MGGASGESGGSGGRPVLPCRLWPDRWRSFRTLGWSSTTTDSGAWQTWYLGRGGEHRCMGHILPDGERGGRAGRCSPALSPCFQRTPFSLEMQTRVAAQTRVCDRRFLKKGRGSCLSRENSNGTCSQGCTSSFQANMRILGTLYSPMSLIASHLKQSSAELSGPEGGAT